MAWARAERRILARHLPLPGRNRRRNAHPSTIRLVSARAITSRWGMNRATAGRVTVSRVIEGRVIANRATTNRVTANLVTTNRVTANPVTINPAPTHHMAHRHHHRGDVLAGDASRFVAITLFAFAFLSGGAHSVAASAQANAHFSEASAAFEAENFSKARALFEQALAEGMDGPAVHYNIGASAYRAGDLPRAERAFREVARTPSMAAVAHYNLGLVALDRRDEREARDWFERAMQQDPADPRLMALASRRLAELPQPRAAGTWSYYARGGAGYDDNIALRSDSIESSATGEQDSYGELALAGNYSFGAWRLDAGAGMLRYMDLDDFSQTSLYLGGARGFRRENWYFELGAYGSELTFGGDVFERNMAAGVLVTRMFYGGSRLRAQLRATSVEGHGQFSGLTGDRTEFGLYYDKAWRSWYFGAHTRGELNDSEDPIFETRWVQIGAEARYALSPMWGFSVNAALRRTRRPAQSGSLEGWDDNRTAVQVGATRALWRQTQLYVRYEHERNDSPVAGFDYDRNRVCASVEFWY
jgi:tetratricopeptide (TPR) repeat protein